MCAVGVQPHITPPCACSSSPKAQVRSNATSSSPLSTVVVANAKKRRELRSGSDWPTEVRPLTSRPEPAKKKTVYVDDTNAAKEQHQRYGRDVPLPSDVLLGGSPPPRQRVKACLVGQSALVSSGPQGRLKRTHDSAGTRQQRHSVANG